MSLAWWNGRAVPAETVRIAPDDAGFLHGDGLFETLRVDDGKAHDVGAHLERLLAGLRRVEIEDAEPLRRQIVAIRRRDRSAAGGAAESFLATLREMQPELSRTERALHPA